MSRGLDSAMTAAGAAGTVRPVCLFYGDFASGAVRVCSHLRDLTWDSQTWTALGPLIGFEELRETGSVEAIGAVFTLSGIPSSLLTKALEAGYRRRRCSFYVGYLNESDALVADPVEWRYRMDRMTIQDSGDTSTITLRAEANHIDLQRPRELRMTDQGQQAVFAGDRAFEYVAALNNTPLVVGGRITAQPGPATPSATPPGDKFDHNADLFS